MYQDHKFNLKINNINRLKMLNKYKFKNKNTILIKNNQKHNKIFLIIIDLRVHYLEYLIYLLTKYNKNRLVK